jgi:hypothetical protein
LKVLFSMLLLQYLFVILYDFLIYSFELLNDYFITYRLVAWHKLGI